jgi:ABC-type Mn2+/Zn2+ transport system permease subunit/ABC-type Zn uptake system ZnuABC Zn-binding protein ZnuA
MIRTIVAAAAAALAATALAVAAGCGSGDEPDVRPAVVVTTPVLGSIVEELAGEAARVEVVMPNGIDPHDFQPSAKDVEAIGDADLVVENGLGLEESLEDALDRARADGVPVFAATDHVSLRGRDPHIWTDPVAMRAVASALAVALRRDLGLDVAARADAVGTELHALDAEVRATLAAVPLERRVLVTGHESMGYFADRYGFRLIGAVIPSLSSQAQASAERLARLRDQVRAAGAPAIFNEVGTPDGVAEAVADETGARLVEVDTHALPDDGSYSAFVREVAGAVAGGLGAPRPGAAGSGSAVPVVGPFLDNAFMLRALIAGCLVAVACAIVGTFVVLRGLAFIGDALAHGVLPGIAGAVLLGLPGIGGAVVGAAAMIAGVGLVRRRSRLSGDTAIGLLFVGMLALGVVIVSRSDSFSGDLARILFGEVLGISWADIWVQLGAAVAVAAVAAVCARPFLLLAFDREQVRVAGFSAERYEWLMLGMVALTVVVSFQTVGTLLVFGMLIAPPATAALVARRVGAMMALAALLGALSVVVGLLLSYHYDLAAGATIVLVEVAAFFVALTARSLRRPALRPAPA